MKKSHRWGVLLAPLVFPWVVVTWSDGWYVLFSTFWMDPGPRFVTMPTFLSRTTYTLGSQSVAFTWPLAFILYLFGLGATAFLPERPAIAASAFLLAGIGVGFYAGGIATQSGLRAVPAGTLILWILALLAYRESDA